MTKVTGGVGVVRGMLKSPRECKGKKGFLSSLKKLMELVITDYSNKIRNNDLCALFGLRK